MNLRPRIVQRSVDMKRRRPYDLPTEESPTMPQRRQRRVKDFAAIIAALEKKRRSRIFVFVQGNADYLSDETFKCILRKRDKFKRVDTLEILLHSHGGAIDVAYQLSKFFRRQCRKFNVIVPLVAKSAATLMCLNADTLHMGEFASLGPLDVQIQDPIDRGQYYFSPLDEFKSMKFLRDYAVDVLDFYVHLIVHRSPMSIKDALHEAIPALVGTMQPLYAKVDPSKVGGYSRALAIGEEYAMRLLAQARHPNTEDLVHQLVWHYPAHDFVIDYDEAREIGLPVQRLELSQDRMLVSSLLDILNEGVSIYDFVTPSPPRGKGKKQSLPALVEKLEAAKG